MKLPRALTPHTVTLRPHEGEGAYGDVFGEERVLKFVKVEENSRLVVGREGTEELSTAQVYARPEHAPIPLDSEVTLPSGRVAKVISVSHLHHPPAPEHYAIALT